MSDSWIDGRYHTEIDKAMTDARDWFDLAYNQSGTSAELAARAVRVIESLSTVVRLTLTQATGFESPSLDAIEEDRVRELTEDGAP